MGRRASLLFVSALLTIAPSAAFAQADARAAFDAGKTAFTAGQFDKARDQFLAASKTDVQNAEVFLWLGKAEYELGQLDAAMAAWTTTLKLAPDEPYASRMLASLRGQFQQADLALTLIDVLVSEQLFEPAMQETQKLLADKSLNDGQRVKAMTLRGEALLGLGRPGEVPVIVHEMLARYPKLTDNFRVVVLLGRSYLRSADKTAQGLAMLKKIADDKTAGDAGATAQAELAMFDLDQAVTAERVDVLAKWVAANPEHAMANAVRRRLVEADLAPAAQGAPARPDTTLTKLEIDALTVAADILKRSARAETADRLVAQFVGHLTERYGRAQAFGAAAAGADGLLKLNLPRGARLTALEAAARFKAELAVAQLTQSLTAANGGAIKANPVPVVLTDALAAIDTINREYPNVGAWKEQLTLADRMRGLAAQLPWPAKVTELKTPLAWAVQIYLPIIKADADEPTVTQAVAGIGFIVDEVSGLKDPTAAALAEPLHGQILAALSPQRSSIWMSAMWKQAALLNAAAVRDFNENVRLGKDDLNDKLTPTQEQLIGVLGQFASRYSNQAAGAVANLANHLQPWIARGHYKVAEDAYAMLAKALPEGQQRLVRLAVIRLWLAQADIQQGRLLASGLTPARQLDPLHKKALEALYALQADIAETDPLLVEIRGAWDGVVANYKRLEYFDIAAQAMRLKADPAVPVADSYAQLQLIRLNEEQAWRELAETLKNYKAGQNMALTPAHKACIDAYTKFITDWPASPLVAQASESIFNIARGYEQRQAFDAAGEVWRGFVAFAAKQPALSSSAPGSISAADQAAFAGASALDMKARQAFSKAMVDRKPETPPPAKISDEFAAAVTAYKDFVKARPASPLLASALQKMMAIALDYARADAWDVADGVYAEIGGLGLPVRYPERLELCRAVTLLGKAMPDHAKEVLAALVWGAPAGTGESASSIHDTHWALGAPATTRPPGAAADDATARYYDRLKADAEDGAHESREALAQQAPADGHSSLTLSGAGTLATGANANINGTLSLADPKKLEDYQKQLDQVALATIRQQETQRANQVAMMRDNQLKLSANQIDQPIANGRGGQAGGMNLPPVPVLSDAELARLEGVFDGAYKAFTAIRTKYPTSITAEQARGEIMVMIAHWRTVAQWQRAASLAQRFLTDNAADGQLPQIRLQIARDFLAYAARPVEKTLSKQDMLAEVSRRFDQAREALLKVVTDFPDERALRQQAQWDIATSVLTQARAVDAFSPTLARGQYVRAAKELQRVASTFQEHPNISAIPQMLWDIGQQLAARGYSDEAMIVWNDLVNFDPANSLAQQAAPLIAQTYQVALNRPMRAVETYLEINFARGGQDIGIQNNVFQIGSQLRDQKRWVEALSVLETFVDSFPRHPNAGQALTMIGQIHQANEAWEDAIKAYRRVIDDFASSGNWVQEAKWSIAECTINLSQWREATTAYEAYVAAYPGDGKVAEAQRRIGVLKDLDRYQNLVNEDGQRKAFDAQFQIATIVQQQLANPTKAIIEFRKVQEKWPKSHLAAGALYQVGVIYLQMGEIEKGREALSSVGENYPDSTLADDALYMLGKSYEDESQQLAGLTRGVVVEKAKEQAQKQAYQDIQRARNDINVRNSGTVQGLRAGGKGKEAELAEADQAAGNMNWNGSQFELAADKANKDIEMLSALQLADRQDKINAALRKAVAAYTSASKVPGADKAGDALLRMAVIYDEQLKDSKAALDTWQEIVRQFSGTAVAEEASWRIAQYYERDGKWNESVEAYKAFLRNYRRSPKAGAAQIAIAEGYEHKGEWVNAMEAYTNYINNFPDGPMVKKAQEQINWIKTYRL